MEHVQIDLQARVPKQTLSRSGDQEVNRSSLSCGDPVTPQREKLPNGWLLLSRSLHCFLQFLFFSFSFPSTLSLFSTCHCRFFSLSFACCLFCSIRIEEYRTHNRRELYAGYIWNSIRRIWIHLLVNEIYWTLDQSEKKVKKKKTKLKECS